MPLKERVYKCGNCGVVFDRDLNAAINLEKWHKDIEYPKNTPSSGEIKACGEWTNPLGITRRHSVKHEGSVKPTQLTLFDSL
jgi:hypothetical protein